MVGDLFDDVPESQWPREWRRRIDGPNRRAYVVLRERFRAQCAAENRPCHICSESINYGLKAGTHGDPRAFELDHYEPVVSAPALALEPTNFRASHAVCNRRRAAAGGPDGLGVGVGPGSENDGYGVPSEDWNTV